MGGHATKWGVFAAHFWGAFTGRLELERDGKRLAARLRFAGLRQQATPEDVDHRAARGLDRALFQRLTAGEWIERHQDLLVTGPTGTGKT